MRVQFLGFGFVGKMRASIWHNAGMASLRPNRRFARVVLALCIATGALWIAHGRVLFTVGAAIAAERDTALEELFEPTGVQDELGKVRGMDRGFRLGLLPSGSGTGLVSVSTLGATIVFVWLLSSARRPSGASHRDRRRPPACP